MNTKTVTLRLTPEEHLLLNNHCQLNGRTQNDVLREYIRSLATAMPNQRSLPKGWEMSKNQRTISCVYRGKPAKLIRYWYENIGMRYKIIWDDEELGFSESADPATACRQAEFLISLQ